MSGKDGCGRLKLAPTQAAPGPPPSPHLWSWMTVQNIPTINGKFQSCMSLFHKWNDCEKWNEKNVWICSLIKTTHHCYPDQLILSSFNSTSYYITITRYRRRTTSQKLGRNVASYSKNTKWEERDGWDFHIRIIYQESRSFSMILMEERGKTFGWVYGLGKAGPSRRLCERYIHGPPLVSPPPVHQAESRAFPPPPPQLEASPMSSAAPASSSPLSLYSSSTLSLTPRFSSLILSPHPHSSSS